MYGEELTLDEFIEEYTNNESEDNTVEIINFDTNEVIEIEENEFKELIGKGDN